MDFEKIKQLLNRERSQDRLDHNQIQKLRDCILSIKEFQNLRKQTGGDDQLFDECMQELRYEFYQKNSLIMYSGQKRERFYFILQGSCGQFLQKEDSNINKEIKYYGILEELQTNLKHQQAKLAKAGTLEEEQLALNNIKNLQLKISTAEATLFVYRKEGDQQRLKEAILSIEDKQLRSKLHQKHFQLNNLCLYTKEKQLISGDTIDQINLNGKDIKSTTITYEDSHIISIGVLQYIRIFQHIVKQITQSQKIMRNYFPDINEEVLQMLSYEFTTQYYQRNEVIYHQNAVNSNSFFILLSGSVEIRKYTEKNKKQLHSNAIDNSSNLNSLLELNSATNNNNNDKQSNNHTQCTNSDNELQNDKDKPNKIQNNSNLNSIIQSKKNKMIQKEEQQQQILQPKLFNSNDPFHSIMVFSGQQVFGTECYTKINEYSAVSISTETKVIVINKNKFDLYDHQFDFRAFLKKQAKIQNKFYQQRLLKLEDFSKKKLDEQIKNRQLIYTQVKHKTAVLQSNRIGSAFNLDTPQAQKLIKKGGSQQEIQELNEGSNNILDLQSRLQQDSLIQTLLQQQNGQNVSFKEVIQKLIASKTKQEQQAEQEAKKETQLPLVSPPRKQVVVEHNQGFEFELNEDKKRRTNILIDYKVKKQLNYKSLPKKSEENEAQTPQKSKQKLQNNSNNNNNDVVQNIKGQKYVQREGQFPWLDQFGYRKEMEAGGNLLSIQQIASKMKQQDEIMNQLKKRNSQDLSPISTNRGRLQSSLERQQIQSDNLNSPPLPLNEIQQIPEKQQLQSYKSCVNLEITNKQILRIKSSINIMKEQDQQEHEQIHYMQKIFSSNSIFKSGQLLNDSQTPKQINQELQSSLSQNKIANFIEENQSKLNRSLSQNLFNANINSPSQKFQFDFSNTPEKSFQQRANQMIMRKSKKNFSTFYSSENPFKREINNHQRTPSNKISSIELHPQNEAPSLSIISPLPGKHKTQISFNLESIKKDIPSLEKKRLLNYQLNLLKKRNLISENFSPSLNSKMINNSHKQDNSIISQSFQIHQPFLTDRLIDQQKDSSIPQFKRQSENIYSNTPQPTRANFYRQSSQDIQSPTSILNYGNQRKGQNNIKSKISNFVR